MHEIRHRNRRSRLRYKCHAVVVLGLWLTALERYGLSTVSEAWTTYIRAGHSDRIQ